MEPIISTPQPKEKPQLNVQTPRNGHLSSGLSPEKTNWKSILLAIVEDK
jgi:hypothetical protein